MYTISVRSLVSALLVTVIGVSLVSISSPLSVQAAVSVVDLKINASDGPISVPNGTIAYLSWTSTAVKNCTLKVFMDGTLVGNLSVPTTASDASTPPITATFLFTITCQKKPGSGTVTDSVTANAAADPAAFGTSTPVTINGYSGSAMEPFIARDGQFLFFNDSSASRQMYYATRVDDTTFTYVGEVGGVNVSTSSQIAATMDTLDNFYFVSTKTYDQNYQSVYSGPFSTTTGAVDPISTVTGISLLQQSWIDMDVGISPDGQHLYYAEAYFPPGSPFPTISTLAIASKTATTTFSKLPNSATLMAKVNQNDLNYAPDISPDGLELFFTRSNTSGAAQNYRATRTSTTTAFSTLQLIVAADGYVEGPSLTTDTKRLYYHKQVATSTYAIYTVTRP